MMLLFLNGGKDSDVTITKIIQMKVLSVTWLHIYIDIAGKLSELV